MTIDDGRLMTASAIVGRPSFVVTFL